jgi:trk system potassium uptake protein TrkA
VKILIAGAGRLGRQAAHLLAAAGHQVTIIDRDRAALAKLDGDHLHRELRGDACEPDVLEEAAALTADLLVAATGEDEDNLVISLLAKRRFAVPRVLARVNDMDNAWLFDQRWGVDVVLPAASPLVSLIEEATGAADTIGLLRLAAAGVSLIETRISADSGSAGRTLGQVALPPGTVVAALIRDGQPSVPGPNHRLRPGDTLLVVSHTATDADIKAAFQ